MTIDEIIALGGNDPRVRPLLKNAISAYRDFVMFQDSYWYDPYRVACDELVEILGDKIEWPDAIRLVVMNSAIADIRSENGL